MPNHIVVQSPSAQRVLRALFELARLDRHADAGVLARVLGLRPLAVARALLALDAVGLVRAEVARLTLPGLAIAARLGPLGLDAAPDALRPAVAVGSRAPAFRVATPAASLRGHRRRNLRAPVLASSKRVERRPESW